MREKLWTVGLAACLAAGAWACGQSPRGPGSVEAKAGAPLAGADLDEGLAAAPGRGRGRNRDGAPGRGIGREGGGRGMNRRHVALTPNEERMIHLTTVRADYQSLRSGLQAMGNVYAPAERKAIISYPFPARVARVLVRPGEWVKRNQPVVMLQAEEVGATKAAFLKALADLELAESSCEREKRLVDRGVGARKALLAAESELKVARSSLDAAEKRLHVVGLTDEDVGRIRASGTIDPEITLYAPVAGKIVGATPVLGSMADQSTEILTIMDPTSLCVDAEVYERDLAKLRPGQDVAVTVPAYPGETFVGRICYIGDVVKPETRTITVRTEIDNRRERLKDGMYADVRFFLQDETKVLALPERAILDDQGAKLVFVKTTEGYWPQTVTVGLAQGGYVQVLEGLARGDEVVLDGNFQLKSKLFEEVLKAAGH